MAIDRRDVDPRGTLRAASGDQRLDRAVDPDVAGGALEPAAGLHGQVDVDGPDPLDATNDRDRLLGVLRRLDRPDEEHARSGTALRAAFYPSSCGVVQGRRRL